MKKQIKSQPIFVQIAVLTVSFFFLPAQVSANNLSVTNVSLTNRVSASNTVVVNFDVSWENSWRTKINHDAVWVTVRLHNPAQSPSGKKLCQLVTSGLNPAGTSIGSNSDLEVYVPSDKVGAFLRPNAFGTPSSMASTNVQLKIDYSSCGFASSDSVVASVLGIEMVYVPAGAFYAGDYNSSTAALNQGSADSDPWYVAGESAVNVSNPVSDGFRYVSAGNSGEDATGTSFTLAATYPKGYAAFYAMKYEVTEEQWAEFVNSLPSSAARSNRDLTDASHKNTDTVVNRNTISCSGSPLTCSTSRSFRAASYLNWMDLAAFLDWAALRPLTELEFEKMSRGPHIPVAGEFAWGTTDITAAAAISGALEDGTEAITTTGANAHYNNTTLSGGDTANGAAYQTGPLRGGIFATGASTRETAGAGYYGLMELSGNVAERVVTIGNANGRLFQGTHGDGVLSTASGSEGNATNTDWPGIDAVVANGVTAAAGAGVKGGGWNDQSSGDRLRASDRNNAASPSTASSNNIGGRGVRTYDGS